MNATSENSDYSPHLFAAGAIQHAGPDEPVYCLHCGLPFYRAGDQPRETK